MMGDSDAGTDASSIKPVSSLRSRFENLGKDGNGTPQSPLSLRHTPSSSLLPSSADSQTRAGQGVGEAGNGAGMPISIGQTVPTFKKKKPDPPRPRPSSMIAVPTPQQSPLIVTVESPRSPQKTKSVDFRPPNPAAGASHSVGSAPAQDVPNSNQSQVLSRSTSPTLGARVSNLLHASESLRPHAGEVSPSSSARELAVKATPTGEPPPVNRTAKPKVPAKPPKLGQMSGSLAAPEHTADLTDRSISPFSTPPSSGNSSPERSHNHGISMSALMRHEPDLSGIDKLHRDLNTATMQPRSNDTTDFRSSRSRAESSASFVEPSSLPDSFGVPPMHHQVAMRREYHNNGHSGALPAPTRYRNRVFGDINAIDSLPEDRPRLPVRPELQTRSSRTSPTRARVGRDKAQSRSVPREQSIEEIRRASMGTDVKNAQPRPNVKATQPSALSQGFERTPAKHTAPAIPAPRRSMDRRREMPAPTMAPISASAPIQTPAPIAQATPPGNTYVHEASEDLPADSPIEPMAGLSSYPDSTRTNRRPPKFRQRPWGIPTDYDTRLFAVCGDFVCTTGYITKAWNLRTGELLLSMDHRERHRENVRATSIAFKPSSEIEGEGRRIWLGTNTGEILEIDLLSQRVVRTQATAHSRREVTRIFRYASELWTLDDGGELNVWKAEQNGMPSLDVQAQLWRIPRGHTYSIACGKQLWVANNKDVRVFLPSAPTDTQFQVLRAPLSQPGAGDITCGATLNSRPDAIFFGHSDGKVSVYSRKSFTCMAVVNVSVYRIISLAGVGDYLWAGYSTGMAYVYDTSTSPWIVKKDWQAHEKQISSIIADPSATWKTGRLNVVTLGTDNYLRIWNGTLEDDWMEAAMQDRDFEYCSFQEMTVAVLTWNAGASKPHYLSHEKENFFRDYLGHRESPDIFVFGFQELVDLEDKKMTAKSFFKSKKKDPTEQEHMSHQYRAWRDHLVQCINDYVPSGEAYTTVHCSSMVGLFTCIFVKSSQKSRVRHVHGAQVKRGMGGLHGNKGAIIARMVVDDSSLCFINCHLAAGQTQTINRNNDIAAILEASPLPSYPLNDNEVADHIDVFTAGGDGSMILDHEICILNGDLNYRIDTMGRDTVIKNVQQGNLAKLLERDQLLLSSKKNPGFRLRAFTESPISFAPTYKYDVRSDNYDTSEKRRAPAWCDRILYRGLGKVKMEQYRRWDQIRVSDHRPVSGWLRLRVKAVDARKRERVWDRCAKEHEGVRARIARAAQIDYLTNVLGMPQQDAAVALSS